MAFRRSAVRPRLAPPSFLLCLYGVSLVWCSEAFLNRLSRSFRCRVPPRIPDGCLGARKTAGRPAPRKGIRCRGYPSAGRQRCLRNPVPEADVYPARRGFHGARLHGQAWSSLAPVLGPDFPRPRRWRHLRPDRHPAWVPPALGPARHAHCATLSSAPRARGKLLRSSHAVSLSYAGSPDDRAELPDGWSGQKGFSLLRSSTSRNASSEEPRNCRNCGASSGHRDDGSSATSCPPRVGCRPRCRGYRRAGHHHRAQPRAQPERDQRRVVEDQQLRVPRLVVQDGFVVRLQPT